LSLIEDFRACQALVDVVLVSYIIGVLAPDIGAYIDELSDRLSDFETVNNHRMRRDGRDRPHENLVLFMQRGLILRNFNDAMKTGDVGRVLAWPRYFMIWFQATKQHNPSPSHGLSQTDLVYVERSAGGWLAILSTSILPAKTSRSPREA
jgi:hypothetical protein